VISKATPGLDVFPLSHFSRLVAKSQGDPIAKSLLDRQLTQAFFLDCSFSIWRMIDARFPTGRGVVAVAR
jgi:hypothetical protein